VRRSLLFSTEHLSPPQHRSGVLLGTIIICGVNGLGSLVSFGRFGEHFRPVTRVSRFLTNGWRQSLFVCMYDRSSYSVTARHGKFSVVPCLGIVVDLLRLNRSGTNGPVQQSDPSQHRPGSQSRFAGIVVVFEVDVVGATRCRAQKLSNSFCPWCKTDNTGRSPNSAVRSDEIIMYPEDKYRGNQTTGLSWPSTSTHPEPLLGFR